MSTGRLLLRFGLLFAVMALRAFPQPAAAPAPLRVCVVAADPGAGEFLGALAAMLGSGSTVASAPRQPDGTPSLAPLAVADAAVFHRGPGRLGAGEAAALRAFLGSGRGVVVLGATREAWVEAPDFLAAGIGGEPGGRFAGGAPLAVINLFPHPILAGVERFETSQPVPAWTHLAPDAQIIMEGTVGEETTPLAWVRRRGAGRVCHLVPVGGALLADPAYLRIIANAVRWAGGRPIPDARAVVQRTFMPESHPGSFAITFPSGPGVCLDPVRGGINFIWAGDFVDLRPRWLTKQGEPARIFGPVFYRESRGRPFRSGVPGREPEFRFRGYRLTAAGPEFHYQVDGREVFETLAPSADGRGLSRRFRVGAGAGPLWLGLEPQPEAEVTVAGVARDGDLACFASSAAGEFTIEIRRRTGVVLP